ncbi:MAG: solute carrier family 23 protein [Bacilli bacterium]|nr:solute carrier family 23 protein [Bacilli bacterium]
MKNKQLIMDVNEKPKLFKWIILSIQHVFAMFSATILVPILVNSGAGAEVLSVPVALFAAGFGTILFLICTKGKSPTFLGSSFAYITPIIAAYMIGGIGAVFTGIMSVGLIYMLISLIIKMTGNNWINKLLPPIVVGPMIMIIGLSLSSSAVSQIGLVEGGFDLKNLIIAGVSFLVAVLVSLRAKGFLKIIPILSGIAAGYTLAVVFNMVDFSLLNQAKYFAIPNFKFPFIHYNLNFSAILTIVPIGIVTLAEHIGDQKILSSIIGKDILKDPGLERTLLGDGVATFFSAFMGSSDTTTYGENVSVVGMTKVASVWVIGLAAVFSIILAFFSKFIVLFATIPAPILGGISILLFGFIASNGIKTLVDNKIDFSNMRNIVIASTMLVLGLGGAVLSFTNGNAIISVSGMSLAAIIGVILNLLLPEERAEA